MRALARVLFAVFLLASTASAEEIVPPATRDVTAPGMMPGPTGEGPLIREPAPPRLPNPPRWRRFFLPQSTDAATFVVKGVSIHIAGVTPLAADAMCGLADGGEWPCGRTALFALRMFLRGRAVECFFPYAPDALDITAPCRVGRTDLALWLLKQGWAKPDDLATGEYRTAAAQARCVAVGLWRGAQKAEICP